MERANSTKINANGEPKGFTIQIDAPCSNHFIARDHIEINIHLGKSVSGKVEGESVMTTPIREKERASIQNLVDYAMETASVSGADADH